MDSFDSKASRFVALFTNYAEQKLKDISQTGPVFGCIKNAINLKSSSLHELPEVVIAVIAILHLI